MPEVVYVPAGQGWTPAQVTAWQDALSALAAEYGWDGKFRVLPAGITVTTHLGGTTSSRAPAVRPAPHHH